MAVSPPPAASAPPSPFAAAAAPAPAARLPLPLPVAAAAPVAGGGPFCMMVKEPNMLLPACAAAWGPAGVAKGKPPPLLPRVRVTLGQRDKGDPA